MCLKEYHVFTFSNQEALNRAIDRLRKIFKTRTFKGTINKVTDVGGYIFRTGVYHERRNLYTYDELVGFLLEGLKAKYLNFTSWSELLNIVEKLGENADVFGRITVELR